MQPYDIYALIHIAVYYCAIFAWYQSENLNLKTGGFRRSSIYRRVILSHPILLPKAIFCHYPQADDREESIDEKFNIASHWHCFDLGGLC